MSIQMARLNSSKNLPSDPAVREICGRRNDPHASTCDPPFIEDTQSFSSPPSFFFSISRACTACKLCAPSVLSICACFVPPFASSGFWRSARIDSIRSTTKHRRLVRPFSPCDRKHQTHALQLKRAPFPPPRTTRFFSFRFRDTSNERRNTRRRAVNERNHTEKGSANAAPRLSALHCTASPQFRNRSRSFPPPRGMFSSARCRRPPRPPSPFPGHSRPFPPGAESRSRHRARSAARRRSVCTALQRGAL